MTTMTLEQIQALANEVAEVSDDMNESVKGGSGSRLLPEGYAMCRLVEYIECGSHPQEYQGQAKDAAPEIRLGFALWGEGITNEDGTPYVIRPYPMAVSRNEKAKTFLLFKSLNWKGDKKHFAQLLGSAWLAKIITVKGKAEGAKPRSSLDLKGFLPPLDPMTKQPYPVPMPDASLFRLFLWERPTLEGFASLKIDGDNNFIQEQLLSAVDYPGSALQMLFASTGTAPPVVKAAAAKPATPAVPATPAAAAPAVPAAPAVTTPPFAITPPVLPNVPAAPAATASVIAAPAVPSLPSIPALPSVPAMPSLPAVPA